MPPWLGAIPGIRVDYQTCTIEGHPDALEAAGVNIRDIVDAITHSQLPAHPAIRPYQSEGARWILQTTKQYKGAILADDMGLGKTRTALWAAANIPYNHFTLIVAPAAVAHQWQAESAI